MLQLIYSSMVVVLLMLPCSSFCSATMPSEKIGAKLLAQIKSSKIDDKQFGIWVADISTKQNVFVLNSDRKFIPASLTKLCTAAAALNYLKPGTHFKTLLLADKSPSGKVLAGNIYLKGGGDPAFVSESLWFLVNVFVRTGITAIKGDIVVDESYFDGQKVPENRDPHRNDRAYDAPTSAMSFNWNSVNIFVRPGLTVGEAARVYIDPENEYIKLNNMAKTGKPGGKSSLVVNRKTQGKQNEIIDVSGSIPLNAQESVVFKNITEPAVWAGYNLKSFLRSRNIEVSGAVKAGVTPSDAVVVAEHNSRPVEEIVKDMQKFSNNFVAEMLTKHLGVSENNPGSIDQGVKKIRTFLISDIGIISDNFSFGNPAGFSRENEFRAEDLGKLLVETYHNFSVGSEFVAALPLSGIDGTLRRRLVDSSGWIRAKTGYLSGVVGLAGYAGRRDVGGPMAFVFMYNGKTINDAQVRSLFDRMAEVLVR